MRIEVEKGTHFTNWLSARWVGFAPILRVFVIEKAFTGLDFIQGDSFMTDEIKVRRRVYDEKIFTGVGFTQAIFNRKIIWVKAGESTFIRTVINSSCFENFLEDC